jgi:hypothetical protein
MNEPHPSDRELLAFLARTLPEAGLVDEFPNAASRVLAMALYRQDQRLQRIEAALVRAGLTSP